VEIREKTLAALDTNRVWASLLSYSQYPYSRQYFFQNSHFVKGIWVQHVVQNPQYKIGEGGSAGRLPPAFAQSLEQYVTNLPGFK
jgi:hypothetical protein